MTALMSVDALWRHVTRIVRKERFPEVLELLKQYRGNPDISRVRYDTNKHSFLHYACAWDMHDVVHELIKHHNADVNSMLDRNRTPLSLTAYHDAQDSARILLRHPLVNLDQPGEKEYSPLWRALHGKNDGILKLMIASGKPLSVPKNYFTGNLLPSCVDLIRQFEHDPIGTRKRCRDEVDWPDDTALFFANIIFLSDGLLQLNPNAPSRTASFFNMTRALPIELQMIICHRMTGSCETLIRTKHRETAFRYLAYELDA